MFVIDASIVVSWLVPDEDTAAVEEILVLAKLADVVVPAHFHLEVANALRTKMRRGDLDQQYRDRALDQLIAFGAMPDLESDRARVLQRTIALSDRHGLTVYDAAYLELAARLSAPLATLDGALRRAAQASAVEVHPA